MTDREPIRIVCKNCKDFFWAKRSSRKFCSVKCRQDMDYRGYMRRFYKSLWIKRKRSLLKKNKEKK